MPDLEWITKAAGSIAGPNGGLVAILIGLAFMGYALRYVWKLWRAAEARSLKEMTDTIAFQRTTLATLTSEFEKGVAVMGAQNETLQEIVERTREPRRRNTGSTRAGGGGR